MRTRERYQDRPQGLSPRQCCYILNLTQGMSRRGAALAAGYSERVADNVAHAVEGKRRGRFSMIRRFVQLVTANRPELLGGGKRGDSEPPTAPGIEKNVALVRANLSPNRDHGSDFEGSHLTPEGPSPLELAEGLIEALSIPMNASLLCQVSNCIEMKAKATGMTFAEAHDFIRQQGREHPPPDGRWALWFREDTRY